MSRSTNPIVTAHPGICRARARRRCAGRCMRPRRSPVVLVRLIVPTTSRPPSAWAATARVSRSRASCSNAATTHCASSATTPWRQRSSRHAPAQVARPRAARQAAADPRPSPRQPASAPMPWPLDPGFGRAMRQPVPARPGLPSTNFKPFARVKPSLTPMRRGRLPKTRCRHATRVDGLERSSGRNASPSGTTPSNISSPAPEPTRGSWTEVSPGARAQRRIQHAHAPPSAITWDGPLDTPPSG